MDPGVQRNVGVQCPVDSVTFLVTPGIEVGPQVLLAQISHVVWLTVFVEDLDVRNTSTIFVEIVNDGVGKER